MRTIWLVCALAGWFGGCAMEPSPHSQSLANRNAPEAKTCTPPRTPPDPSAADAAPQGAADSTGHAKAGKSAPAAEREVRKIIYTGLFTVVVSDVTAAQDRLKSLATDTGGYLQSLSAQEVIIRVPSGKFDQAVSSLGKLGMITRRDIRAQDVTDEVTDLETRLRNAKALKDKVLALLDRAGTLQAALELEREAARVTLEIERLEGVLARMGNQVAFGTITVQLQPSANYTPPAINPQLPFDWLRGVGLEKLMRFQEKNLY